jgi:hypothetical protein
MDAFLRDFTEQTAPLHEQVGIPIVSMLVNRPQNEFMWEPVLMPARSMA